MHVAAAPPAAALQVRVHVCGGVVGQVIKIGFRTTQIRVKIDGEMELLFCHQLVEVHLPRLHTCVHELILVFLQSKLDVLHC